MAQKKKTTKKSNNAKKPAVKKVASKIAAAPKVEAPKPVSVSSVPSPAPFLPKKKKSFLARIFGS